MYIGEWNRTPPTAVIRNGIIGTGPMQVVAQVHRLSPKQGQVISRYISIGADQADQHYTCLVRLPNVSLHGPEAFHLHPHVIRGSCCMHVLDFATLFIYIEPKVMPVQPVTVWSLPLALLVSSFHLLSRTTALERLNGEFHISA